MSQHEIRARQTERFCHTTDSNHDPPVAANLLDRCFVVEALNRAWVTDMIYVATREGWLYVTVLLDLFSRRVVGLAMSDSIDRLLVLEAHFTPAELAVSTRLGVHLW